MQQSTVIVDEVLYSIKGLAMSFDRDAIQKAVIRFYPPERITAARDCILSSLSKTDANSMKIPVTRKGTGAIGRSVLDILDIIDESMAGKFELPKWASVNPCDVLHELKLPGEHPNSDATLSEMSRNLLTLTQGFSNLQDTMAMVLQHVDSSAAGDNNASSSSKSQSPPTISQALNPSSSSTSSPKHGSRLHSETQIHKKSPRRPGTKRIYPQAIDPSGATQIWSKPGATLESIIDAVMNSCLDGKIPGLLLQKSGTNAQTIRSALSRWFRGAIDLKDSGVRRQKQNESADELIFTIDPETARDLDDALCCQLMDDGTYEVGVHIADVSYFVEEGCALDREALRRATSVYMVQMVVPMLPRLLCEKLCSLNPGEDRLAFSTRFTFSPAGDLLAQRFATSVIRSRAKLSYEVVREVWGSSFVLQSATQKREPMAGRPHTVMGSFSPSVHSRSKRRKTMGSAATVPIRYKPMDLFYPLYMNCAQRILETDDLPHSLFPSIEDPALIPHITRSIRHLFYLSQKLREKRIVNGALRLDQVKLCFQLDPETKMPMGFSAYQLRDSNRLIEEFMLLANISVAVKLFRTYPTLAFLRRHPEPHETQLDAAVSALRSFGIIIDTSSSKTIADSLAKYVSDDDLSSARLCVLTNMISKPMQLAKYFCAGVCPDPGFFRHYALSVPLYTHFTSPIRRYPDVIVHRMLKAAIGKGAVTAKQGWELQSIAEHCNLRKEYAKKCSELSSEMFLGCFISACGPLRSKGMIMGVLDHAFEVLLLDMGSVCRVYTNTPNIASYNHVKLKGVSSIRIHWAADPFDIPPPVRYANEVKKSSATPKKQEDLQKKPAVSTKYPPETYTMFSIVRLHLQGIHKTTRFTAVLIPSPTATVLAGGDTDHE
ncbi:unnamed protein product [Cyprideis torosa]|uniref:RNB domain-containing protein n=1 Tax=Cyprideis torosa TaxID=163714 RepID=A0A7R8ZIL3_9CRUS|nr:unnamed protein product [Cyprideis torosa]CAG0885002.1 unnamed protein product [Cyprideis torosa]